MNSLRSVFRVLVILVGLWLVVLLWQIILLFVIALILAGTLSPILAWLEQHHISRTVALGLILIVLVFGIVGLGALVIPALLTQTGLLATGAPTMQGQLADYLASIPLLARSVNAVRSFQPHQMLEPLATSALSFAGVAAEGIILGLTTVVLAFYLIADPQRVKGFFFALLPRRFHLRAARILLDMEAVVGGYVRGQLIALAGFGIASLIEIFASVVVVWQLRGAGKERERRALRLIGLAFVALAVYVLVQSARTPIHQSHPTTFLFGIVWLAATVVVMLILAWGKHRMGKQLNNPVLLTEARVTLVDAYLAAAVLAGLTLNALFGWWWADPLAGLVIVYYGIREGLHAYHESASA